MPLRSRFLPLLLCALICACNPPCTGDDTDKPPSDPKPEPWEPVGPLSDVEQDRERAWKDRRRIDCGDGHTCAILEGGRVECWGTAELRRGAPDGKVVSIASGRSHVCALREDRSAVCWGKRSAPATKAPEDELVWVDSGRSMSCGLRPSMEPVCWQYDGSQLGEPEHRLRSLSMAGETACGLRPDGTVSCWGDDPLDDQRPGDAVFAEVAVGWQKLCGRTEAGDVRCWGDEAPREPFEPKMASLAGHSRGGICALTAQARDARCFGFDERSKVPERVKGPFERLLVSQFSACGLREDGSLKCWGGAPWTPPAGPFADVAHCGTSVCGVRQDGTVACAGNPYFGQTRAPEGTYAAVASGRYRSCALREQDRTIVCWGGQPGDRWEVPEGPFAKLAMTDQQACALRDDGSVACWTSLEREPNLVSPPADLRLRSLSLAPSLACGVTPEARVVCWGANSFGLEVGGLAGVTEVEAGSGFVAVRLEDEGWKCFGQEIPSVDHPTGGAPAPQWKDAPCPGEGPKDIAVSEQRVCWSGAGDALRCITYDSSNGPRREPVDVVARGSFRDLAAGWDEVCALTEDGQARCWGGGGWNETEPPEGTFRRLAPGWNHVCALDEDGALHCWGGYAGTPL